MTLRPDTTQHLYLVRHGQTMLDTEGRLRGRVQSEVVAVDQKPAVGR